MRGAIALLLLAGALWAGDAEEMRAVVDRFAAATTRVDQVGCVDVEHFRFQLRRAGLKKLNTIGTVITFFRQYRLQFDWSTLKSPRYWFNAERDRGSIAYDIYSREAKAVVRQRMLMGRTERGWRIQDIETPEFGGRASVWVACGVLKLSDSAASSIWEALDALQESNFDEVGRLTADLKLEDLPTGLHTQVLIMRAWTFDEKGKWKAVLDAGNRIVERDPTAAMGHFFRASGLNGTSGGDTKEALAEVARFEAKAGTMWYSAREAAYGHRNLDQYARMEKACRAGIACDPQRPILVELLLESLPTARKSEAAPFLRKLDDLEAKFWRLADDAIDRSDYKGAAVAARVLAERKKGSTMADVVLARVAARRADFPRADRLYRAAIKRETVAGWRREYVGHYLFDALRAGRLLAAYEKIPDRGVGLKEIAPTLANDGYDAVFARLLARRLRDADHSPVVRVWQAHLRFRAEDWKGVLDLLANDREAIRKAAGGSAWRVRELRAFALYRLGRRAEAIAVAEKSLPHMRLFGALLRDDAALVMRRFQECVDSGWNIRKLHDYDVISHLLKAPKYDAVRKRFPRDG